MPIYAILDTNVGLLQWIGEASEEGEAYDFFAEEVNEEPYDVIESTEIFSLTPEEAIAVRTWWDNGAASHKTPDCISHYPRRAWGR